MKLFDFDDILIEPAVLSDISSRNEINCRFENGMLPLMTAPMDTVVDKVNFHLFKEVGILPVLPRIKNPDSSWVDCGIFLSYSMSDFERLFLESTRTEYSENQPMMVLIDVANGHMSDLHKMTHKSKQKYGGNINLMVGNVANPETFYEYVKIGVDYVRIGIGNGNGCLTTVQTGVGYPMASLISECRKIKNSRPFTNNTKIIADGGFKKYSDIIKALAIGADFVMLGSILNKCLESAGETRKYNDSNAFKIIDQYSNYSKNMFNADIPLFKTFRGMSTKEAQKSLGKIHLTTSEGVVKKQKVEYTIEGWVNNFESYLKSAMSYTGKKELHHFIGGVKYNHISENSFRRFDK
jgi:IMP dehydrogenase/GMP reductase